MGLFSTRFAETLHIQKKAYKYCSLKRVAAEIGDISPLPKSMKILLENVARSSHPDTQNQLSSFHTWLTQNGQKPALAVDFSPARVLMQDFTGVPAVVDLAAMRDALKARNLDPQFINPLTPVDLVIDHSVMVDFFSSPQAFHKNVSLEYERNKERYQFLRWGQQAFKHFRVVPPGTGICHQVNLEHLSQCVWTKEEGNCLWAYPDTLVGTDSHTTMVNGLSVLGWGVGGIEAEAAMLGQSISMLMPDVIGVNLTGNLFPGATATDLVLTITHKLREKGVVSKFVEFYGDGLDSLTLPDRATISNMSPEFGSTCAFFPIDQETLNYLRFTGRNEARVALVEAYAKEQGLWRTKGDPTPVFTETLTIDLDAIRPSLAGPKRPQDRVTLKDVPQSVTQAVQSDGGRQDQQVQISLADKQHALSQGDVVIAAITSCTNTSNPSVMVAAGLVARKAREKGLKTKPWVKTSFAPGSKVVTAYLEQADLMKDLESQGFHLVGYGCTTCIGNSGPLDPAIEEGITRKDLSVGAVLSGNRNFEGRIHAKVKLSYLASPPLVVAYALAGSLNVNMETDALGDDAEGNPVYLKDLWPSQMEVQEAVQQSMTPKMFQEQYAGVFDGDEAWQNLSVSESQTYPWDERSTYVKHPPYFSHTSEHKSSTEIVAEGRFLALLGDSVTTDHISPAGAIKADSPAGKYLQDKGVAPDDFNSYGSRRGNHEIMMRGTFANIRLQNEMVPHLRGGYTVSYANDSTQGEETTIFEAAMDYARTDTPLVIFAGQDYGVGSSRDWAAKGTRLLGVKAVIAQSFERIHRSNLIGMGILPLQLPKGVSRKTLGLTGVERLRITGEDSIRKPRESLTLKINGPAGEQTVTLTSRLDTANEVAYYHAGGILHYVMPK